MGKRDKAPSERATDTEIELMPALIDTYEYALITGMSPLYVARLCKQGKLPATKCGRRWLINRTKALEALGL